MLSRGNEPHSHPRLESSGVKYEIYAKYAVDASYIQYEIFAKYALYVQYTECEKYEKICNITIHRMPNVYKTDFVSQNHVPG